ncbi:MAG: SMP-30/gluconolactonase/LRE family protein [Proteobacteria bacterium]|nr:MAG: SMP-30/gluconolactonase/LRE family protein [Pseudomonadota bacterium]
MKKCFRVVVSAAAVVTFALGAQGHERTRFRVIEPRPAGSVPESVATDGDNNLYYSDNATIRIHPQRGRDHVFSTLPIPVFALGVKIGPDECVYNTSVSLDPTVVGAFVWRSCEDGGTAEVFATLDPTGGPNDLAFDDRGNLFVTDPFLARIWKVTPDGTASVWLQDPLFAGNATTPFLGFAPQGVNGIAFDEDKENLYVGNLDYGRVIRIPISRRGAAGRPKVVVESAQIQGIDGIAFDKDGDLYAAINGQDKLVRISPRGRIETLAQGGVLDGPSSVAFGSKGRDKKTLYIASSAFTRTFGIQEGTPDPALLSTEVDTKGLPLP